MNVIFNECLSDKKTILTKDNFKRLMKRISETLIYVSICLLPFVSYQTYAYNLYCVNRSDPSEWCLKTIPLSYSYIQEKYWNVGFLRYYQFKQIPNFLLALPIIILMFKTSFDYFTINMKNIFKILTLKQSPEKRRKLKSLEANEMCLVHVVHALALTLFCVFFVHIQVTTRMLLSASPLTYWSVASIETKGNENKTKLIKLWFYGYFTIGILLHSNFLPFT